MAITAGQDIVASDFVSTPSGAADSGKVAKLDANGEMVGFAKMPVVNKYDTPNTAIGSSTTQFDITNPAGTTFRYTYDGTGTDPSISGVTVPVGSLIHIDSDNFNSANNGLFVVTGSGANYFEVTNASGVAENNKTIGTTGFIIPTTNTWTKPSKLKYITIEMVAAGGTSKSATSSSGNDAGSGGGGAGGYTKKTIPASSLASTEYFLVGHGGVVNGTTPRRSSHTAFGVHAYATRGAIGGASVGGDGGVGVNGDINVDGGYGGSVYNGSTSSAHQEATAGVGGVSFFGGSKVTADGGAYGCGGHGVFTDSGTLGGYRGAHGLLIVTEYY